VATTPKLKIKAATAQELCTELPLSGEARSLLDATTPPLEFVDALSGRALYSDAVKFLARALPKREAVWWSCLCARDLPADDKRPELGNGLAAAEEWVYRPTEDNRRKAEKAANDIKASHPARWTAMAAFWSGGSLAPPNAPEAKPAEDFTSKAVAGAILMAVALDPSEGPVRNKRFLEYGVDIAKGGTGRPPARM
jgi:uncharacterized protein DUF6931